MACPPLGRKMEGEEPFFAGASFSLALFGSLVEPFISAIP
jgi:hypothetical protein